MEHNEAAIIIDKIMFLQFILQFSVAVSASIVFCAKRVRYNKGLSILLNKVGHKCFIKVHKCEWTSTSCLTGYNIEYTTHSFNQTIYAIRAKNR